MVWLSWQRAQLWGNISVQHLQSQKKPLAIFPVSATAGSIFYVDGIVVVAVTSPTFPWALAGFCRLPTWDGPVVSKQAAPHPEHLSCRVAPLWELRQAFTSDPEMGHSSFCIQNSHACSASLFPSVSYVSRIHCFHS